MLHRLSLYVPELFILGVVLGPMLLFGVLIRRRTKRFGCASAGDYLRATPRSDAEKRDAADLALRGLVLCVLGLLFRPLILSGLVPLFYGGAQARLCLNAVGAR